MARSGRVCRRRGDAKWNGTALYRFEDGRIAESTYVEDLLDLQLRLGITEIPAA
ncbi:hypothetical protein [Streptomyces sp. NBC_00859]|uniref:hypothetical protein n=1 Tax=Streptomyces sp. NBC_00859 TaxID=2903682 RepID=UPI0038676084|nr:ester cyclase [Streptomyces sp. NBC_00859]